MYAQTHTYWHHPQHIYIYFIVVIVVVVIVPFAQLPYLCKCVWVCACVRNTYWPIFYLFACLFASLYTRRYLSGVYLCVKMLLKLVVVMVLLLLFWPSFCCHYFTCFSLISLCVKVWRSYNAMERPALHSSGVAAAVAAPALATSQIHLVAKRPNK